MNNKLIDHNLFFASMRNSSFVHGWGSDALHKFLPLYFITCWKEGLKVQIVTEQIPIINRDAELFDKDIKEQDMFYEQTRLVLKKVPAGKEFFLEINDVFNELIRNVPSKLIDQLSQLKLNEGSDFKDGLSNDDFANYFDDVLHQIVTSQTRTSGEFILPSEIGAFLTKLVYIPDHAVVFNPFAGLATFGVHLKGNKKYHGQEIERSVWAVSMLRLNAHNRLQHSTFKNSDTFLSWPKKKYDLIITNPPFKLRLNSSQKNKFDDISFVEELILGEGLKLLKKDGKIVCTVPLSFLSSSGRDKKNRKRLIDGDLLEAVISFPGGLLMQTNIPFAVLVINKSKHIKNHVAFFDASQYIIINTKNQMELNSDEFLAIIHKQLKFGLPNNLINDPGKFLESDSPIDETIFIKTEQIRSTQYNYNLVRERYELDNLKGTELGKIIREIPKISAAEIESNHLTDLAWREDLNEHVVYPIGKLIRIRDLKHSFLKGFQIDVLWGPKLDIKALKSEQILRFKTISFINENAILVALTGKYLKPTEIELNGQLVALSKNILAFQINEQIINKEWFISQLNSSSVSRQLKMLRVGTTIPYLRKNDFLRIRIQIPSIEEQIQELARTQKLVDKIETLESDIIKQNTYLRHELSGRVGNLVNSIKNIDEIISKISKNILPEIKKIKLTDDHLYNLGQYIAFSKKDIEVVAYTVKSRLNVYQELERAPLERIDFLNLVEKYAERKRNNDINYKVDFDFDKDVFTDSKGNISHPKIYGNSNLIRSMLDNLLDNAEKHGFNYDGNDRFELYITANLNFDNPNDRTVVLIIANTGNPMEPGLKFADMIKKGTSYGKGAGEGFGSWYVDQIVRKHNGDWYSISERLVLDESSDTWVERESDLVTIFQFEFPFID